MRHSAPVRLVSERSAAEHDWRTDAARAELLTVTVRSVEPDAAGKVRFCIGAAGAPALRAAGCLVEPLPGDVVLVADRADGDPLILSVLTRATAEMATLSVPDAAGLHLAAAEIALTAQRGLSAKAYDIAVNAENARFNLTATQFFGDSALVILNKAEALYTKLQSYAERLIVKAGYSLRLIDELDSTVASTVLVQAKQTYSLQSTQTILSSTQDTRIDGERISMG